MDSPNPLYSLSHTRTPSPSHTKTLTSKHLAGNDGGVPAGEDDVDDEEGRDEEADHGVFLDEENLIFPAEYETTRIAYERSPAGFEKMLVNNAGLEEVDDGLISENVEEATRIDTDIILAFEKTSSFSLPKLGFSAQNRIEEDEENCAGFSSIDGCLRSIQDCDYVSMMEDGRMRSEKSATMEALKLGFLEAETTHVEKAKEIDGVPTIDEFSGVVRDGEDVPLRKDPSLPSVEGCVELGFGGGALKRAVNGGCDDSSSPANFNIDEFITRANRVMDGDTKSMAALNDLKTRWEKKFGRAVSRKINPVPLTVRKPWRCVWPAKKDCLAGKETGDRANLPAVNTENVTNKCCYALAGIFLRYRRKDVFPATSLANRRGESGDDVAAILDDVAPRVYEVDADVAYEVTADVIDDIPIRADVTDDVIDEVNAEVNADVIADVNANVTADVIADVTAEVTTDVLKKNPKFQKIGINPKGLFVGNIPLHTSPEDIFDDKIAHAFNKSTRKTLSFIAPTLQNGEVIVRPTLDIIRNGSKRWRTTAVGYFLGKRPYFHHVKEFAMSVWSDLTEVTATTNGFFFFQFKTVIAMEDVIEGGPWLFQGQPIVLQKWEPGMALRKLKHTQVLVWIKLRHLPMELWTEEGLSIVASGVGKPLYPDAITRACTRLDFARVCVMLDATSNLPKHIIIMTPNEDGGESPCKIDVEYEWLPTRCNTCMTLGHTTKECAHNKTAKSIKTPVAVYVPKVKAPRTQVVSESNKEAMPNRGKEVLTVQRREKHTVIRDTSSLEMGPSREERGKALVIYNSFDALQLFDDAEGSSRGPKPCSPTEGDPYHQLALKDLVSEYRLHFLGILETRVRISNVVHTQSYLLPQWKWFVDDASVGNRIWIAWDDNLLDVHILDLGEQFIHYRFTIKALHESCIITIAYGASEVIDRRTLWHTLGTLAPQCSNNPWLVGGDFNVVRDLNEVCGISGDIRITMEDFNNGIQEAGLLPLPMQGEWYTWHNRSTTTRSLWKRLDRILINDRWLERFPTSSYHSLLPRTSDHSPLVLYGDSPQHNGGMFRFDNYLTKSPDFIPSVQNIWQHEVIGVPMYAVTRKLKALKQVFRQQRRNKGDLTRNVQLAKGFLDQAQTLVSSDRQNELFLYLEHCCRMVYAKAAKTEQIMLQQRAKMQWMRDGDQCSRVFFRKIAQRRATRRILQINDEHGTTHTDPGEVVHEFVSYYQNLLGGNRRRTLVDINYLRPWARHILSNEEASHLLAPFSPEEVKLAVFDIAEDKAPGPDGYSSGFYKAAWPVVGAEVIRAVLEFFSTGRLLKQVNSTVLALIPKVHTPMSAAFIPGRSIGDNIMLAQELFMGYNQARLTPRCALKVDIRKAYDTVEWDFLVATLQLFGFPPTFTRWIEECISTTSFSVGLNGTPHGFFAGARGLRQGDPLSPFLFVLVMEVLHIGYMQLIEQDMQFKYHWKCEPTRVFQLGFADDLLLFCRADLDSFRVLKVGLDRFAEWSGLRLNIQKSHIIISRSAQERKDQLLSILGFQEGHLPMRYLGLPLISSRLTISDCQPLLSKIDARIAGWEGMSLSYARRVQIIKSVLSALSIYWASAFILPKAIIKEVEKRLKRFLWKGTSMTGYAKVAWKDVCKPVREGGQGIKDIDALNRALMTKKLCDIIRCDRTSIWVEWLQRGRLQNNSIWTIDEKGGSWGWRKLLRLCSLIQPMVECRIGDGRTFYLWKDPWHHFGPLIYRFPRGPSLLGLDESTKLNTVIDEGQWQ
ncbi:UNVERIFIED_CONTAM: Transposon TX1 uncharacterized protein [Sesamum indicum]